MVKIPPAMQETWVWSLDWEDPLEEGMGTHSSVLAWRTPRTEEPGRLWGHKESDMTEWLSTAQHSLYVIHDLFSYILLEFSKVILLISHPIEVFESPRGFRLYLNSWGYFHFLFFIQYECTFVKHSPYLCKNSISMGYSFFFHRTYNQDTLISVINWFSKSSALLLLCNKLSECISDLNFDTILLFFALCSSHLVEV